ncbi:molybdopterin-guanine dinucleotide biosynthesis protein B [Dongia soli]|uniref:Molybdopterin-guanine dinucleotide biosynthesis protein B n=1 Tax=Dongia soli TaxID=600628 RepID=A0ABU5E615_9PROT|nr:molybdopterin-guanine dinucleotide biosynthesis protein B [Dongia soli]MDY0881332.1 molybdopterin-guanine dinucleotide biosynthesis protein B [Dongia soli]
MKILGLTGWSGAGKTTLMVRLIPELVSRGLKVSTMKHAHHAFDVDKPGKDSHRHREAGATEVLVSSEHRWALMHEHRGEPEPSSVELMRHMTPVDLLLIEGFKRDPHDKLEIYRPALGKPLLSTGDPSFVAVLSDAPVPETQLPLINLNDIAAIADFIQHHWQLYPRQR